MQIMNGKIVLITGSSSGIGRQAAIELAGLGATVLVHACNAGIGKQLIESLRNEIPSGSFDLFIANFEVQDEIQRMAQEIKSTYSKLDVLVNNAAIYTEERKITRDTVEKMFAVNHLGSFLITHLLLPWLQKSGNPRIINVSSHAHYTAQFKLHNLQGEKTFNAVKRYSCTKLYNILFTYQLAAKLKDQNISVNALHPGFTNTEMYVKLFGEFDAGTLSDSADTIVYLASSAEVSHSTGLYYMSRLPVASSAFSYRKKYQRQLWKISERLTMVASLEPLTVRYNQDKHPWQMFTQIVKWIRTAPETLFLKKIL